MSGSDISEHGPDVKKQKRLPHRGKLDPVMDDFLGSLRPATTESLMDFNSWEKKRGRPGVVALYIPQFQTYLKELRGMTDIKDLDAKINEIDTSLATRHAHFEQYIVDGRADSENVELLAKAGLEHVIWGIKEARKLLPGRFSHRMSC